MVQSSLFSQAMGNGGLIGGSDGRGVVGCGLLVVPISARGGGSGVLSPCPGTIDS